MVFHLACKAMTSWAFSSHWDGVVSSLQSMEVLLVVAVYGCCGSLEACPNLVTLFFGHGSRVAEFLVQLLPLVEGRHDIRFCRQLFGCLAQALLDFQILLEVVLAEFVVQLQQVVEFLHIELIVFPQFVHLGGGHEGYFVPLLLQLLELSVVLVGVIGRFHQFLQLFDDGELYLQVHFPLFLLFGGQFAPLFFDDGHDILEFFFRRVRGGNKVFGRASVFNELFLGRFLFSVVQLVEGLLQAVDVGLRSVFHVGSDFFQFGQDLFFGEFLCRFYLFFSSVFLSRSFRGYRFGHFGCFLFFF